MFGQGQTYHTKTAVSGTIYFNETSRPILVVARANIYGTGQKMIIRVNEFNVTQQDSQGSNTLFRSSQMVIVPAGGYYNVTLSGGASDLYIVELR